MPRRSLACLLACWRLAGCSRYYMCMRSRAAARTCTLIHAMYVHGGGGHVRAPELAHASGVLGEGGGRSRKPARSSAGRQRSWTRQRDHAPNRPAGAGQLSPSSWHRPPRVSLHPVSPPPPLAPAQYRSVCTAPCRARCGRAAWSHRSRWFCQRHVIAGARPWLGRLHSHTCHTRYMVLLAALPTPSAGLQAVHLSASCAAMASYCLFPTRDVTTSMSIHVHPADRDPIGMCHGTTPRAHPACEL